MTLYKYVRMERALEILRTGLIRFTQPISFDDPFEGSPVIEAAFSPELMSDLIDRVCSDEALMNELTEGHLADSYFNTPAERREDITLDEYVALMKDGMKYHVEAHDTDLAGYLKHMMLANLAALQSQGADQIIDALKTTICLLCLSSVNNQQILWAKYADESFGVAVGFNSNDLFFENLLRVIYVDNRPKVSIPDAMLSTEHAQRILVDLVSTKSTQWGYEEEYRILRGAIQAETTEGKDQHGFPIHLYRYPPDSVVEVIFGTRVNDQSPIRKVLMEKQFSGVRIGQVKMSRDQFQLIVAWDETPAKRMS